MKLEMISTGEEVLSGQIVDTNAAWFSDTMMNLGIELQRRTTVGDRLDDLVDIFRDRSEHADVILVNGGLGPTSDDMSVAAAARALGEELVENAEWRRHLETILSRRKGMTSASNLKQCLLPASAVLVDNPLGTAPGFRIKLGKALLFFTPGVPSEFQEMVNAQFIPFIANNFKISEATRLHKLLCLGHGESSLVETLKQIAPPTGITIGYRPSSPHVEIKLFARGKEAIENLPDFAGQVKKNLGSALVAEGPASIAEVVHQQLLAGRRTLSVAESFTGGMVSDQLIEFEGCSDYFVQGLVTYTEAAKRRVLKVPADVLERHGVVSNETARAMARNVRELGESDLGLATTGYAGPGGGSPDKPVGTVCLAVSTAEKTWVQTILLSQRSRKQVRVMSCAVVLDMLRRLLLGENPIADYASIERVSEAVFDESQS